ncbi:uncharacterized protein LOC136081205 [Hydra vulgaris]|uniref:Uncharacterized protein LOC136081205 n=1 Tax=Hydra vulgaris TaxID=6087 RepID=A0ABM4BZA6_HYDVU
MPLRHCCRNDLCVSDGDGEILTIEIINERTKNILISCCYRPPDGVSENLSMFLQQKVIAKGNNEKKKNFLIGDFNMNCFDYNDDNKVRNFYDAIFESGAIPLINLPTRVTKNSATLLDNIISTDLFNSDIKLGILKTDISNHFPIFLTINTNQPQQKLNKVIKKLKNDSKSTWKVLKEITGKQKTCSSSLPQMLKVDNNSLYEPQIIAHEFNKYFTEIGSTLSRKIPNTQTSFYDFLVPIDKDICSEELSAKLSFDEASIHQDIFPERLKLARVTPIHKKGDRSNISNYRPISVLSIFSKILERIIFNRVYNYFNYNNLFHDNQYGFRKGSSTEHAIIQFIHNISESFEKSQYTLGVFIDLSKAFDTNHRTLIKKVKHYGLNNKILKWFKSYLTNRKQLVYSNDGQQSEPLSITCDVPQGSILGPPLLLIYVNDLNNASKLKNIMFADDTNLFLSHTDVYELFSTTNKELNLISNWFKANKLILNINKTKWIIFYSCAKKRFLPSNMPQIYIDETIIKRDTVIKFLGVYLDENIT